MGLLVYTAIKSGMLSPGKKYDFDFDHEFLESETWEAKPTYKGFMGYGPECAVLTDTKTGAETLSGIENRFLPTLLQNLLFADFRGITVLLFEDAFFLQA